MLSGLADIDFYRGAPPGGYTKGLAEHLRTDVGNGDIAPESRGEAFFAYKPYHMPTQPPRPVLAKMANDMQALASSGKYDGMIWTQGSPQVEETAYWYNLLIDTTLPICGNSAQRPHGQISNDGPKNIVDSVQFIASGIWADADGRNRCGVTVIQEQQIFAAREVAKADARPGGYIATGGHGGILGQISHADRLAIMYVPAYRHTYCSDVNLTRLPRMVTAVRRDGDAIELIEVAVKDADGLLSGDAVPVVSIIKDGSYSTLDYGDDPELEHDLIASIAHKLSLGKLAGLVCEGLVPYGTSPSTARNRLLLRASFSGLPVVRVGRGAPEGFADVSDYQIAGSNLTATKARLLLMACLLKFGSLPPAQDPAAPTPTELAAIRERVADYQRIFDTH
jgi:L-asparaginase